MTVKQAENQVLDDGISRFSKVIFNCSLTFSPMESKYGGEFLNEDSRRLSIGSDDMLDGEDYDDGYSLKENLEELQSRQRSIRARIEALDSKQEERELREGRVGEFHRNKVDYCILLPEKKLPLF